LDGREAEKTSFLCWQLEVWQFGILLKSMGCRVHLPNATVESFYRIKRNIRTRTLYLRFGIISNRSFLVYRFEALSLSIVLLKCLFILWYLCFLSKNHRCHMNTNFLDDGKSTDAVPSMQRRHPLFPLVCPDTVKPPGASWMQTNMIAFSVKYSS
jgi:hypothetical protein